MNQVINNNTAMNGVEQLDHSQSTSLAGEFMTQMKQCL